MELIKRTALSLLALTFLAIGIMVTTLDADARKRARAPQKKNIVQTARADGSFETLTKALRKTGLSRTLSSRGPFTVFAPSDSAFGKLPKEKKEAILNDTDKLPEILKYHVVKGKLSSSDLAQKRSVVTVQGESLMLDSKNNGEMIVVDGAIVTKPDVDCRNGVIHVIDYLLVPERGK